MFSWDRTIFKDIEVFDPEYIPSEILFRESQISQLVAFLRPAAHGAAPVNVFCVGPPSTGKTLTIRYVLKDAEEHFKACYIRCPRFKDPYKIFSRIFETVCGQQPPVMGISKTTIMDKVWEHLSDPLVIVLDDINFIPKKYADEVLYEILKASDEYAVKVGVITAATDVRFPISLDPFVSSIFKYSEVHYPTYTRSEMGEILRKRIEYGFIPDVFEEDAFEKVVELAHSASDVRYGLYLLKASGTLAENSGSRKVRIEHVEKAHLGESLMFVAKIISTLNSEERAVLRMIYSFAGEITTGDLYEAIRKEVNMSYRKFYNILDKLERIRLVDVTFGPKGRGRTRYIYRKYDPEIVEKALREF